MNLRVITVPLTTFAQLLISTAVGQFYPDGNAGWCLYWTGPPDGFEINRRMRPDPDTVIMGKTYKILEEFTDQSGNWELEREYYVRSTPDGKGYLYLPDSAAEFVVGDTAALAGDTVHQVLCWYDGYQGNCGSHSQEYAFLDAVVDSVVSISNMGVTVRRHFVRLLCADDLDPEPQRFFWQAGMGTSFGPVLRIGNTLGWWNVPVCATVDGVNQFGPLGLPGGVPCCGPITIGLEEESNIPIDPVRLLDPAGLYVLLGLVQGPVVVCDLKGATVLTTSSHLIDLTDRPSGVYVAQMNTSAGRQAARLVVVH